MRNQRRKLTTALLLAVTALSLPLIAQADASGTYHIRVTDPTGANVYAYDGPTEVSSAYARFAAASFGRSDCCTATGKIALDHLIPYDAAGRPLHFEWPSTYIESTNGDSLQVLQYDIALHRPNVLAESQRTCTGNYQSMVIDSSVRHVKFEFTRTTGSTPVGEGKFWDVVVGIIPSDDEAVGPSCGSFANLQGVQLGGSGDYDPGDRSLIRAYPGHIIPGPEAYMNLGVTYTAELWLD